MLLFGAPVQFLATRANQKVGVSRSGALWILSESPASGQVDRRPRAETAAELMMFAGEAETAAARRELLMFLLSDIVAVT